jgi:hypothetical protein
MPPGTGLLAHSTHPPCYITLHRPAAPAKTLADIVIDASRKAFHRCHHALAARRASKTDRKDNQ